MRRKLDPPHGMSITWDYLVWYCAWRSIHDRVDLSDADACQVDWDAQSVAVSLATLGWCLRDAAYCAASERRGFDEGYTEGYADGDCLPGDD